MQRVREHSTDDGTPLVYSFWLKPYGALYFTLRGYGVPFIGGPGKITGYTDEPVPDVTRPRVFSRVLCIKGGKETHETGPLVSITFEE